MHFFNWLHSINRRVTISCTYYKYLNELSFMFHDDSTCVQTHIEHSCYNGQPYNWLCYGDLICINSLDHPVLLIPYNVRICIGYDKGWLLVTLDSATDFRKIIMINPIHELDSTDNKSNMYLLLKNYHDIGHHILMKNKFINYRDIHTDCKMTPHHGVYGQLSMAV